MPPEPSRLMISQRPIIAPMPRSVTLYAAVSGASGAPAPVPGTGVPVGTTRGALASVGAVGETYAAPDAPPCA